MKTVKYLIVALHLLASVSQSYAVQPAVEVTTFVFKFKNESNKRVWTEPYYIKTKPTKLKPGKMHATPLYFQNGLIVDPGETLKDKIPIGEEGRFLLHISYPSENNYKYIFEIRPKGNTVYLSFNIKTGIYPQKSTKLKNNIRPENISPNLIHLESAARALKIWYLKIIKYKKTAKEKMETEINKAFEKQSRLLNSDKNLDAQDKKSGLKKLENAKKYLLSYLDSK